MAKIALIETKPSRTDYVGRFDSAFEFDRYALCSDRTKKKSQRPLPTFVFLEKNKQKIMWSPLCFSKQVSLNQNFLFHKK